MPHMFTNRVRLHSLTKDRQNLRLHFRWETIEAILYKTGGLIFIAGSIFFFPRFEKYHDAGAWIFFAGSLVYLVACVHDLLEVRHHWRTDDSHDFGEVLEYTASASYVSGTILFIAGSIFFLSSVGLSIAGAWCFIVGSLFFVLGASINVVQIVKSRSVITLQLMNFTAVSFVVGSVLFTVASIPYLWKLDTEFDRTILYAFLAWQ